jgi:hypothetical protein
MRLRSTAGIRRCNSVAPALHCFRSQAPRVACEVDVEPTAQNGQRLRMERLRARLRGVGRFWIACNRQLAARLEAVTRLCSAVVVAPRGGRPRPRPSTMPPRQKQRRGERLHTRSRRYERGRMLARRALLPTWSAWESSRSARRGTSGRRTMVLAADRGHVAFPACVLCNASKRQSSMASCTHPPLQFVRRRAMHLTRKSKRVLGIWLALEKRSRSAAISWRSPSSGTVPLVSSTRPRPLYPHARVARCMAVWRVCASRWSSMAGHARFAST